MKRMATLLSIAFLQEALEFNRADARSAAAEHFEEVRIAV